MEVPPLAATNARSHCRRSVAAPGFSFSVTRPATAHVPGRTRTGRGRHDEILARGHRPQALCCIRLTKNFSSALSLYAIARQSSRTGRSRPPVRQQPPRGGSARRAIEARNRQALLSCQSRALEQYECFPGRACSMARQSDRHSRGLSTEQAGPATRIAAGRPAGTVQAGCCGETAVGADRPPTVIPSEATPTVSAFVLVRQQRILYGFCCA
jgi:hypothetical protein